MKTTILAAAGALLLSSPAFALESNVTMTSPLSPAAMWQRVGGFCGIGQWHPAIEKCELSANGKERTLSLKGGGTIHERLEAMRPKLHSYSYTILSGPLPVTNYHSTLKVAPHGKGSMVTWSGKYAAKGASDADAKKAIDGVYQSGVKALVSQ